MIYLVKFSHRGSVNDSMKRFVLCRADQIWGLKAIYHLIEMFLDTSGSLMGGEALENKSENDWNMENAAMGVMTADQLLKVYF